LKDKSIDKKVKFELKTKWNAHTDTNMKRETTSGRLNSLKSNSKRRRWFVEVVVPTWAQFQRDRLCHVAGDEKFSYKEARYIHKKRILR